MERIVNKVVVLNTLAFRKNIFVLMREFRAAAQAQGWSFEEIVRVLRASQCGDLDDATAIIHAHIHSTDLFY